MKADGPYVLHILDAIAKIREFCKGMSRAGFAKDERTREAVVRKLEIIGEAAKHLSPEFKNNRKEVPWSRIAGMRDKLIHGYAGVDFDIVWNVIEKELPMLESALKEKEI